MDIPGCHYHGVIRVGVKDCPLRIIILDVPDCSYSGIIILDVLGCLCSETVRVEVTGCPSQKHSIKELGW